VGADNARCSQQVGRSLRPQHIREGHVTVAHRYLLQRGELMDHRVRLEAVDRAKQRSAIPYVSDHRLGAQRS
jgi:hypothetical protein